MHIMVLEPQSMVHFKNQIKKTKSKTPTFQPLKLLRQNLNIAQNACTSLNETWFVYHATWSHLNGILHKSLPSVTPRLQPLKLYHFINFNLHAE
jgi:hypothetical protein